ncbi:MAG TPA: alkaline phosphatase family protein [Armatimonadota bacterium]|nr:alkaline phosphatase family protein [Armatimonadota bacterium]
MKKRLTLLALLLCSAAGLALKCQAQPVAPERPRLVVLISIDQCRADYMTRFTDLYLPARANGRVGGFRYLQSQGAWYPDCRYDHYRTVTGVGHAVLSTGAQPGVNGIVGNNWWDPATGKSIYCTDDPKTETVGGGPRDKPMSPANLNATTLGDELELATGGHSRTVSISLKDRASILLAGHRADQAVWFSESTGNWISSRFFCRDGKLPGWAERLNERRLPDELRKRVWTPGVSADALQRVWNPKGGSVTFEHKLSGNDYGPLTVSPAGNELLFTAAREAVTAESLGRHPVPDLLTLNLASNDYVGHRYGPDSAEVLDISVQTDRQISEFLNFLDRAVPGGLAGVTFAISADHGVATIPEVSSASGVPVARTVTSAVTTAADRALDAAVGPADWIASSENGDLYFSTQALAAYPKESRERIEGIACEAVRSVPGVYLGVGKSAVLSGRVPLNGIGRRITNGVNPARSGDVLIVLQPLWLAGSAPIGAGTSHGQPFPYDTQVPLLMAGFGVRPGTYTQPVSPARLAPTLAYILQVARPSAADEPLLPGLAGTESGSAAPARGRR